MLNELINELKSNADPERAKHSQRFFKTGKGEYGEGDVFIGLTMPQQREITKKYINISFNDLQFLLNSKIHEYRMSALIILVKKYSKAKKDFLEKRKIYEFYMKNTKNINNWDLVDLSCIRIVGDFLSREGTETLRMLATSDNLWERRISIISTAALINKRILGETLVISDMLMNDKQDLIHKAAGWMLREVGKKNIDVLEIYLKPRYKTMPRTMLRYAIEKFPEEKRKSYLKGEI
jgi:3-methyladenine DNA glycosylase AlkD